MAVELEGLSYEIEAQTGDSAKQIDALASSLEKLKSAASGGMKLGGVTNNIKKLSEAVSGIDVKNVIKIRQISKALSELGNAGKISISKSVAARIGDIGKSLDSVSDEKIARVSRLADALERLGASGVDKMPNLSKFNVPVAPADKTTEPTTDMNTANESNQRIQDVVPTGVFGKVDAFRKSIDVKDLFASAGRAANGFFRTVIPGFAQMSDAAGKAKSKLSEMKDSFSPKSALMSGMQKFGGFQQQITTGLAKLPMTLGGGLLSKVQGIASGLGGIFSGLMRIAKFRLYRTIIKIFTEGLAEGIQNVYYYSQVAGTTLAGSLDRVATAGTYVKNSLGAMAAPIIDILAPAIDFIADKLVALFNLINQVFARLAGKSSYTAAKKMATTWAGAASDAGNSAGKAAKNAADELKKTILGFDEINKLNEQNKSSGSGGGGGGGGGGGAGNGGIAFEEVPIDSAISDFVDRLKKAFEDQDWKELGTLLGQKFNEIVDSIPWAEWGEKVGNAINGAVQTAYWFLKEADFENLGAHVAEFLNNALENIEFEYVGRLLVAAFTSGIDFLIGFIRGLDFKLLATSLSDFIKGALNETKEWLQSYDWRELGNEIWQKLKDFVTNIDFAGIADAFYGAMGAVWGALGGFIIGYAEGAFNDLKAWWEKNCKGKSITELGEMLLDGIISGVKNIGSFVKEHMIDPFMDSLIGEDKWEDVQDAGEDIINNIRDGIKEFLGSPLSWVKEHIITPIRDTLTDGKNWDDLKDAGKKLVDKIKEGAYERLVPGWAKDIIAKIKELLGKDDGEVGMELPITPTPKNNSDSWLSKIKGWWDLIFGGDKNQQDFGTAPENSSKGWLGTIVGLWNKVFGGDKHDQSFGTEPEKNSSKGWLGNIKAWWNTLFGGDKNTQKFNAEGNATKLNDKIPISQKSFNSWAIFTEGTDKLSTTKKTFQTIAKFFDRQDLPAAKKIFDTIAKFTDRRNLTKEQRTFDSIANFAQRVNLSETLRTFWSIANFGERKSLSETLRTFWTIANFGERKNLTEKLRTFWSIANFGERTNNLKDWQRTFDSKAKITDVIKPKNKPIIDVDARVKSVHTGGGGRYTMAEGGVFAGNVWKSIARYASGGTPRSAQMFIAREAGPELVGTLGSHTAVMNNDQIVASVSAGVARAVAGIHFQLQGFKLPEPPQVSAYMSPVENSKTESSPEMLAEARRQNQLLARQNELLQRLLEKDTTVEVTTKQFASAANRQNRREGRTTIAVSAV